MEGYLNLVKNDFSKLEKRVLPRFPFSYLTFKSASEEDPIFEVKDISHTGMQLHLKSAEVNFKEEYEIKGDIHWLGAELNVFGTIKWVSQNRIGVEFSNQKKLRLEIDKFLDLKRVASLMKPIHGHDFGIDLPPSLSYWLRADGPCEIFIWRHQSSDFSKFQIVIMENFIEWVDGKGLKSGRVMSKRNIDTPLLSEDEFVFSMDEAPHSDKLLLAQGLINSLSPKLLPPSAKEFLTLKLRH